MFICCTLPELQIAVLMRDISKRLRFHDWIRQKSLLLLIAWVIICQPIMRDLFFCSILNDNLYKNGIV